MSQLTSIEWTDATWNPVRGCSRVSEGCRNCYAEAVAARFSGPGMPYEGLAKRVGGKPRWTGAVRLVPHVLDQPLRWARPRRIFVNSMSDLFHEGLSFEAIAAVFGVMAAAPRHVFQVLTKRPERARDFLGSLTRFGAVNDDHNPEAFACTVHARNAGVDIGWPGVAGGRVARTPWPPPNVWLGVSVEDQATADERIPLLLQCPAAVRFVSYEPALGPVTFRWAKWNNPPDGWRERGVAWGHLDGLRQLDQVIVGGESGPEARPCDISWIRAVREQCRDAGVACFVKQIGRRVIGSPAGALVDRYILVGGDEWQPPVIGFDRARFERDNADRIIGFKPFHPKGGDWSEWPADLRVREFPEAFPA